MSSIVKARSVVVTQGQPNIGRVAKSGDIKEAVRDVEFKEFTGGNNGPADENNTGDNPDAGSGLDGGENFEAAVMNEAEPEDDEYVKVKGLSSAGGTPDPAWLNPQPMQQNYDEIIDAALEDAKAIKALAEEEGYKIVAGARMEAKGITDEAERNGYNMGYAKGLEAGKNDAIERASEGLNEIAYFIEMLQMERMQTYKEEMNNIVTLSFEIAKKIMREQVKVDPKMIPKMIEDIVKENETAVKIVLSEYNETLDVRIDRKTREAIKELLPNQKVIVLPSDGTGEIIQIETEDGMIDAAVSGQIERLEDAVIDQKRLNDEDN